MTDSTAPNLIEIATRPFRGLFPASASDDPALDSAESCLPDPAGPPTDVAAHDPTELLRGFAFVDLCGFTTFTSTSGPLAAFELLREFRSIVRDVASRRGVRVVKWLGDGVLLVSLQNGPLIAACCEICQKMDTASCRARAGASFGPSLLFDGDDYIGRSVNLASRLCDVAPAGQVVVVSDNFDIPLWIAARRFKDVQVKGIGKVTGLVKLSAKAPNVQQHKDPPVVPIRTTPQ